MMMQCIRICYDIMNQWNNDSTWHIEQFDGTIYSTIWRCNEFSVTIEFVQHYDDAIFSYNMGYSMITVVLQFVQQLWLHEIFQQCDDTIQSTMSS